MSENKFLLQLLISIIYCALFCMGIASDGYGQRNYLFENISAAEGLSNLEIHAIFQDKNGFLWISTANGLNRYDGVNMVVFKNDPGDITSLPNNNCFVITEDSEGFLWIGVSGNVIAKYNPANEKFLKYPIETGIINITSTFFTAITDQQGDVWFGSSNHGIQKFNRHKNKFEKIDLDSTNSSTQWGEILGLTQLKNGSIIAADYGNGIKIYNEKLNSFQPFYLKENYCPVSIVVIYEDPAGHIWLGGLSKLIKYTPSLDFIEDYNIAGLFKTPTTYDNTMGIVEDEEGYIWAGVYSQGLYRVDPENKNIQRFDYAEDYGELDANPIVQQIYKDKYNVIWIGTLMQGLYKFDPLREPFTFSKIKSDKLVNSDVNRVNVIVGSPHAKKILVGSSNDGLFEYDLESKKSIPLNIRFDPLTIPDGRINIKCLVVDNEGNKWFTYNNLGLYKIDRNNCLSVFNSPFFKTTTTYTSNTLKIDYSGNIWIASRYGFEKYDPAKKQFTMLPTLMNKQMSKNLKEQIDQIPQTRDPFASILKAGEAVSLEKKFSLNIDQKVLIIGIGEGQMSGQGIDDLSDRGSLLTADGKLIWSMNDLSKTFNDGGGFKNRIVVKCLDLTKGDYKITYVTDVGHSYGTWNVTPPPDSLWYGIQILGINESEYKNISELNEKEMNSDKYMPTEIGTSIEFSKKNRNFVWLGTTMNSFFKYDLTTGNFKQYNLDTNNKFSPNNTISFIMEDMEGVVWIATLGGLLRFDPSTEEVEKIDQKDGLPSNQVNSIIEDIEGNLWVNTSGGMAKLNKNAPRDDWNFIGFDAKDGLQGSNSSSASWTGGDGIILVGGTDGITSFYPGKINEVKPDIVLIDIKVSDVSLKSDSAVVKLEKSIMETEELRLSYFENNLSFEFASIHFSRPEKNKLLYKLDGFNDRWIVADRNFATFTNLSPGEYNFSVKGSSGDGIWNDAGKSIRIIISPPWWKTTWAYVSYGILFLLIVFGIDRVQRRRILAKQQALAKDKELAQAKEIEKAYLELGKAHETLKSTQSQLIQSEKMASLGELTAGIAHEIQNPLNFINNFSEVNKELITEMKEEIGKGNFEEVKVIADDINGNEEKILHHGKRADAIVKGMLQHSRTSTGQKEPTDINDLADEYLRLAYHGLRAKEKSFNADFITDFDPDLPRIEVIPQDIGRVLLNLINNAFYAVSTRNLSGTKTLTGSNHDADSNLSGSPNLTAFNPTVTVSTKNLGTRIEIRVKDNGNGIPANVLDKIFQPFFTTKPTGQGTGLGLSMSYDIITKGHGGSLEVISTAGDGSEFIIRLPLVN